MSATQYSHLQSFDILGILIAAPIETLLLNDEEINEELVESKFNILDFLSFRRLSRIPIFLILMVNLREVVDFLVQYEASTVEAAN